MALAAICLVAAAGFGVWKYMDSKKILLPSKATYTFEDGSSSNVTWNYDKISRTANGKIKVKGAVKADGEYSPIEYDYNKDKKMICDRDSFSETYQKWLTINTYTYDKKGHIVKKKSENYSYETGEVGNITESKFNKYGIEQTGQKIKYTEKDLFGRPKKAISGKKGDGHQEYDLKNGRVIKRKDYTPDGTLVFEAKYNKDGLVIESSSYTDDGELIRKFKREDKKYKIK